MVLPLRWPCLITEDTHLEDFAAGAADGDIVQRVLACLGGTEDSEEAGQRGLIVVPGKMKL